MRSCFDLGVAALHVGDVVAHDRHRVALAGQLHVEDHLAAGAEHGIGADQVELPHAAEALVVHGRRSWRGWPRSACTSG